jgi:transcriptional regulator with XRE-family HTH domain
MSSNGKTIYSTSRNMAGISQEDASFMLNVSQRQLSRYESTGVDSDEPKDEVVAAMVQSYNRMYLGYLHGIKSPVMRLFIPSGVEEKDMVHSISHLNVAVSKYMSKAMEIQAATLDGKIEGDEERRLWKDALVLMEDMQAAIIQVKCAELQKV